MGAVESETQKIYSKLANFKISWDLGRTLPQLLNRKKRCTMILRTRNHLLRTYMLKITLPMRIWVTETGINWSRLQLRTKRSKQSSSFWRKLTTIFLLKLLTAPSKYRKHEAKHPKETPRDSTKKFGTLKILMGKSSKLKKTSTSF